MNFFVVLSYFIIDLRDQQSKCATLILPDQIIDFSVSEFSFSVTISIQLIQQNTYKGIVQLSNTRTHTTACQMRHTTMHRRMHPEHLQGQEK